MSITDLNTFHSRPHMPLLQGSIIITPIMRNLIYGIGFSYHFSLPFIFQQQLFFLHSCDLYSKVTGLRARVLERKNSSCFGLSRQTPACNMCFSFGERKDLLAGDHTVASLFIAVYSFCWNHSQGKSLCFITLILFPFRENHNSAIKLTASAGSLNIVFASLSTPQTKTPFSLAVSFYSLLPYVRLALL